MRAAQNTTPLLLLVQQSPQHLCFTQLATELVHLGRRHPTTPREADEEALTVLDAELSMRTSNDPDDPCADLQSLQQHNIARNFVVCCEPIMPIIVEYSY
jgi:hypothetical protein